MRPPLGSAGGKGLHQGRAGQGRPCQAAPSITPPPQPALLRLRRKQFPGIGELGQACEVGAQAAEQRPLSLSAASGRINEVRLSLHVHYAYFNRYSTTEFSFLCLPLVSCSKSTHQNYHNISDVNGERCWCCW